jgi:hypothetical protein
MVQRPAAVGLDQGISAGQGEIDHYKKQVKQENATDANNGG